VQKTGGMNLLSSTGERKVPLLAAGLIVAATVALYWPALGSGFLGDDFMILHRLRGLERAADVMRFFRGEFFEYYRPLGFVSHAVDWALAGQNARQFHLTNLLIHVVNAILVLLIGRALSPRPLAGLLAAALFALHASNNEAVVWMSARFDLLATCFGLAAICFMIRDGLPQQAAAALFFLFALLSKEAAVALPIAAAGWATFHLRSTTVRAIAFVVPWLVMLALYSSLRHLAGGVSAVGGASRLPKLAAFMLSVTAILAMSSERWIQLREWLRPRRTFFIAIAVVATLGLMLAAALSDGRAGSLAREKLAVAGFAGFYLTSPVLMPGEAIFSDPTAPAAWMMGTVGVLALAVLVFLLWNRLLDDDRYWFLASFLAATLLPISALTEGKRYLYLPSAAASLIVAIVATDLRGAWRRIAMSGLGALLVISAGQIALRIQDWRWAGQMTADGGRLVDSALSPSCGTGHVVFLTSPVAMRGVYSHFYYETFEIPRGCMPEIFQVLVRVVRVEEPIEVKWDGPDQIVILTSHYRDNFVLSHDLREFDVPLRADAPVNIVTPLGRVTAEASDSTARVTLHLASDVQKESIHFFYYADGRIQPLARP
jgi:hypothetical protein